jgi:drug/metabolite transporter (DMT)-like permease
MVVLREWPGAPPMRGGALVLAGAALANQEPAVEAG